MMLTENEHKSNSQRFEEDGENERDGVPQIVACGQKKRKYVIKKDRKTKTHRAATIMPKKSSISQSYSKELNSKRYKRSTKNF